MDNNYVIIDENKWKRSLHCQVFRNYIKPSYCITFELNITNFLSKIKMMNYPFTFTLIFLVSKCANDIEEFRYRFLDGKIVLYNRINTAFTDMDKDTELFKVVNVEMQDTLKSYIALAKQLTMNQKESFTGPLGNDVFQFSPMPWVSYTHISHTDSGKKDNATPLFDWGKYFERNGEYFLPFSVQVHHSFVDGIHIGKLADSLQNCLNAF